MDGVSVAELWDTFEYFQAVQKTRSDETDRGIERTGEDQHDRVWDGTEATEALKIVMALFTARCSNIQLLRYCFQSHIKRTETRAR